MLRWALCAALAPGGFGLAVLSIQRPRSRGRAPTMGVDPETRIWTPDDVLWTPAEKGGAREAKFGPMTGKYCEDLSEVFRRPTRTVTCGPINFGSEHPIVRQTMGTTSTKDVKGTIDQVMRCADEGFDLVRITVVGMKEALACHAIREGLNKKGYDIPLCADMHFQPKVAIKTAEAVEKIRINPGNFADGRKEDESSKVYETDEDFLRDREYIVDAFAPLVEVCRDLGRAMRIGTNHGSLSARILSFYGDSPRGMVESAVEFADICRALDYHNFVFSMKASNPVVMIQGYRLLAAEMCATTRAATTTRLAPPCGRAPSCLRWNPPAHPRVATICGAGTGWDGTTHCGVTWRGQRQGSEFCEFCEFLILPVRRMDGAPSGQADTCPLTSVWMCVCCVSVVCEHAQRCVGERRT